MCYTCTNDELSNTGREASQLIMCEVRGDLIHEAMTVYTQELIMLIEEVMAIHSMVQRDHSGLFHTRASVTLKV